MSILIHPTAEVSDQAVVGDGSRIWHHSQVRPGARLGRNCILGKGVYIDNDVSIGENVKIQNYVSVYHGVTVEDGAFIGPHVCFTNDLRPRAVNPDGSLKSADDWTLCITLIKRGASLGANTTIRCGITIGQWAMIGSGSVVTHDVPDYGLVYGNPARLHGYVCPCGAQLEQEAADKYAETTASTGQVSMVCPECGTKISIPAPAGAEVINKEVQKLNEGGQNDPYFETIHWRGRKKGRDGSAGVGHAGAGPAGRGI